MRITSLTNWLFAFLLMAFVIGDLAGQATPREIRQIERDVKKIYKQQQKENWDVIIPPIESAPDQILSSAQIAAIENWGEQTLLPAAIRQRIRQECTGRGVFKIFDTAADLDHEYLQKGKREGDNYSTSPGDQDIHGHSTHVTGIMVARGFGLAWDLVDMGLWQYEAVKILNDSGSGSFSGIVNAVKTEDIENAQLIKSGQAVVVNGSFSGGSAKYGPMEDALQASTNLGVNYIFAAGNDAGDVNYPANSEFGMATAALAKDLSLASFSSFGPELQGAMPGSQIYSTWKAQDFASLSGTSMASPFLASAVGIAHARWPGKIKGQLAMAKYLAAVATDLGDPGKDDKYGWGINYIIGILDTDPDQIGQEPKKEICDNGQDDDGDGLTDCDDPDCKGASNCQEEPDPDPDPDPKPPTREARSLIFPMPESYQVYWKARSDEGMQPIVFKINVEFKTKLYTPQAYDLIEQETADHFKNRWYVFKDPSDYRDAAKGITKFYQVILKKEDIDASIVWIKAWDVDGRPIELDGNELKKGNGAVSDFFSRIFGKDERPISDNF